MTTLNHWFCFNQTFFLSGGNVKNVFISGKDISDNVNIFEIENVVLLHKRKTKFNSQLKINSYLLDNKPIKQQLKVFPAH
jgi:uncharacterized protein YvpB